MESKIFLLVFAIMVSNSDGRSLHKRAAFYIANETACVVDNTVYYNGDPIPTDDPCEACKCRPPGFACVLKDCEVKPGCRAVRRVGHCCPEYICGCEHNGRMYRDGDEIRDSQNPCYTCHCQGSAIACAFVDCFFRVDCAPRYVNGECCPRYDHCTSTDPTANASFPTESTFAGRIPTTSSIADEVKGSTNADEKILLTTLAPIVNVHIQGSSLDPPNEVKTFSESSVEYANPFETTITDYTTTEKRTESPDVVTLVYEKEKLSGGESESDDAVLDSVSDDNAEHVDSSNPEDAEKEKSPEVLGFHNAEHDGSSELGTKSESKPKEPVATTTNLDEPNGKEENLDSSASKGTEIKSSTESSIAPIDIKNAQEEPNTILEKSKDSTPSSEQPQEEYKASSHGELTTLTPPIPLVYLHYNKGDSSKKSQSSTANDLNQEAQRDGVQPDPNDSVANEISFTTQSEEEENLLSPKGALESDRKPKEKVDKDDETSSTEDTPQKPEESEHKDDAEENATKQDRGLKTASKGSNDSDVQQVEQQLPDVSSTVLDQQQQQQQLSTPTSVQEIPKEQEDESKQQEVLKQSNAGENKQSIKTVIQNDKEAQKFEKQDDISSSPEGAVQEPQSPEPSAQVIKSQETLDEQEQQNVQNAEQIIHKSDQNDNTEQIQANKDRSIKTASSSPSEKEPEEIQHQYEITAPSVETTLDEAGQSVSVPQETVESIDEIKQEIPTKEEDSQVEDTQDDSKRDFNVETVSSTISSSSETTTQEPKQETFSIASIVSTTLNENEPLVVPTHDEKLSDSVGKEKKGSVNRKGIIHDGEDKDVVNTEEEISKQDRSVKTANKAGEQVVQNDGTVYPSTKVVAEEQEPSTPASEQESGEEQKFPTWEEIRHYQENGQTGDHNSRQDKSVKTGSTGVSDEGGQNPEEQGDITFSTSETTIKEEVSTTPAFQYTESQDTSNVGKPETVNIKGIHQSPEKRGNENDAGQDDSKEDSSEETYSKQEAQEPSQQLDDVTQLPLETIADQGTQPSTLLSQKTKPKGNVAFQTEDTKQDRSVKTASTSKSDSQKEAQHSDISPTEESQQLTSPSSIKTQNEVQKGGEPSFPSWVEIHHKFQGNDQISARIHYESRQDRSIKTGDSSDAVTLGSAQEEESTSLLPETTSDDDDPPSNLVEQTTKSPEHEEKKEDGSKTRILYNSGQHGIKSGVAQEVSEQDKSTKTSSKDETKTDTPEPERLDVVKQSTTEPTTSYEQHLKSEQDGSKKDRSVKTASKGSSRTEVPQTIQQDGISTIPTEIILDEQQQQQQQHQQEQLTTPSSQKVSPKEKSQDEQKFPSWEEINYKNEETDDHSRQSRSVKTSSSSSVDKEAQAQNADSNVTITPTIQITLENNEEQTTKVQEVEYEASVDDGKPETVSKKGFHQKSEQDENKDNVAADESKKDRSVKTGSKGTSQTEEQETVRQDEVTPSSTVTSIDEGQVLNPQSQPFDEKNSEQPRFPTWDEISHRYERNSHISREGRSAKTATKGPSETEPQIEQQDGVAPGTPSDYDETSSSQSQNTKSTIEKQSQETADEKEIADQPEESKNKGILENHDTKKDRSVKTGTRDTAKAGAQETVKQDEVIATSTNSPPEKQKQFSNLESQSSKEKNSEQPRFPTWDEISHRYERKSQKTATRPDQSEKAANNDLSGVESQKQTAEQQNNAFTETSLGDTTLVTLVFDTTKYGDDVGEKGPESEHQRKNANNTPTTESQSIVDYEKPKEDRSVKTASKSTSQEETQGIQETGDIRTSPTQAILSDELITTPTPQIIKSQGNEQEEQGFTISEESQKSQESENSETDLKQDISITADSQSKTDAQKEQEQQVDITLPSHEATTDYYAPSSAAPQNAETEIQDSLKGENQKPITHQEPVREPQKQESEIKVQPGISRKGRDIKTSVKAEGQTDYREIQKNDDVKPEQEESKTDYQEKQQNEDVKPGQQEDSKTDYQEIQQNDDVKAEQQEDSKTDSQQTQNNDDTQAEQQEDITLPQQETPTDHYIPPTTSPQTEEIEIQDSLKGENKNPTKVQETIQEPQKQNNEAKIRPVSTKGRDIKTSGKTESQTNSQETQQNEDVKPEQQESSQTDSQEIQQNEDVKPEQQEDSQTDSQEIQQNEDVKPEQQEDSQTDSAETQLNEDKKQQQQEDITLSSQETSTDHYGHSTAAPPNAEIGIQNSLEGENQEPTNDQKTISEPQKQESEDKIRPGSSRKGRDVKTSGKTGSQADFQETQEIEAVKPEQLEDSQTDSQETQQNEAEKSEQLEDTQTDSQKTQQNEAEKSEQLEDSQTDSQEIQLSDDGKQEQEDITLPSQETSTDHYELSTAAPQNSEIEFQDRLKGEYQKPTNDQDTTLEPQKQESEGNTKPGGSRKGRDIKTSSKAAVQAAIQANSQETQKNEDKKPEQQVADSQETQQTEDGKSEQQEDNQTDSQDSQQDEGGKAEQQEDSQTDSQDTQKNEDGKPEQQEDSRTDSQQTQLNDDRKPEQQEDIIFPSQGTPADHYEPSTSAPQNAEIGIQHSLEGETQKPTNHQETFSEPHKQESKGKIGPGSSRKGRDIKTSGKTASQTHSQETRQNEDGKPQQPQQDSQTNSQETQQNEDVKPQQQQDSQTNSQETQQNEDRKPQQQESQTNSQETQENEDGKPEQEDSQTYSQDTQKNEDGKSKQQEDSQTDSQETEQNEDNKPEQQEESKPEQQEESKPEQQEESKPEQQEESQTDSQETQLNDDEKPEQQEDIAVPSQETTADHYEPSITASADGKREIQDSLKGENQKPTNDQEIVSEPQKQESDDKVRPGVNRKGRDIKTSIRTTGQTDSQETQKNSNEKPQQQVDITLSPQETTTYYYEASTTASQNSEIQDNLEEENQKPTNDQETIREQQKQENEEKVRPRVTIKGQVVKTSGQTQNEANLQESLENNDGQQEQQEDSQTDSKEAQQNDDGKPENQEDSQTDSQEIQLNDDGKPEQQEDITLPSQETTPYHYEPSTVTSQNAEIQDSLGEENQRPESDQQTIREPQKQENEHKIRPGGSRKGRDAKTSVKSQSQKNAGSQKEQQNDDEKPVLNPSVSQTKQQTTPAQNPNPENQEFPRWEEIIHKSEDGFQGSLDEENGSKQSRNVKKGTNRVTASVAQNPDEQKSATSSPQETTPTEQFTSVNENEAQQLEQQNSFAVPSEKTSSEEQSPSREDPHTTLSNDRSNYQQEQENKVFTTTSTSPADVKEGEKDSNTKSQDFEEDTSKTSVAQET